MAKVPIGHVVGPPGADAEISGASIGTVQTLPAGSSATAGVTTGGTAGNRSFTFDFGIPQGAKGDPGEDGPNEISADTETELIGVLVGNGSGVETMTVDSAPASANTDHLITSAGVADALAKGIIKVALGSKTGTGSSVTWSKSNAAITADHEVLAYELGTPAAQIGNLTWITSAGAISVSGNINGTTTLTVILGIVGTSVT